MCISVIGTVDKVAKGNISQNHSLLHNQLLHGVWLMFLVHMRLFVQEHPRLDMYKYTQTNECLPLPPPPPFRPPLSQHPIWLRLCSTCTRPPPPPAPHSNPSTVLIWCWSDGQHFEQQTDRLALIP